MSMKRKKQMIHILHILLVAICLVVALFPIYWMLNTSFKTQFEMYQRSPTFWPKEVTLDGYQYLFTKTPYLNSLKNSFLIAFSCAFFSIFFAYPVAYAVARLKFYGRKFLSNLILFSYLIPTAVLYIPLFIFVSNCGLTDNILGLMLIYPTFTLPYVAWMLIPHVRAVPTDIEEAATVDGCNRLQNMYRIVFPLAIPGIVSTFIFAFSMCWGEYLYALVNISSSEMKTFPLVISGLIYGDIYPWNQIMAGAILACIPILLVYIFFSKLLVGGAMEGGVKA
ncbi:MAG: carbohydrate ABC transporter permease [Oscillospiraceae bacterium]